MMRGTGGNRFIPADSDRTALLAAIHRGLLDLHDWAHDSDRVLNLGAVTVDTKRIHDGSICVTVTADLGPRNTPASPSDGAA